MATITLKSTKDAYINSASAGTNYGTLTYVYLGAGPGYKYRMFLGFDFSGIPAGSTINSASLYLRHYGGNTNTATFDLYRVTGTWAEDVTWTSQPSVEASATIAGLVCPAYSSTTWRSYNVKTLVEELITNSADSIMLRIQNESDSTARFQAFLSKEYSTDYPPYLLIDYTAPNPAPSKPTIDSIATITDDSKTFNWSDSTDAGGFFTSSELYYEMQYSVNGGSSWSETFTSDQGVSQYTLDLKTALSLEPLQYYHNTAFKIQVRAKTPEYSGTTYYSDWAISPAFTVDYRIVPTAPTISVDNATPYEGQAVTFTCDRPSAYNTHTAAGAENSLTYYVRLASGSALANDTAGITSETKDVAYTVGNITAGNDLVTTVNAYCVDAENQTGAASTPLSITFKRFRAPSLSISDIDRAETSAVVSIAVQDTGYGGTQSNTQINKVQYNIGAGYVDATLGTWSGLNNSFTIPTLPAGSRYALSVRAVNNAPLGLSNKTGAAATDTILEYTPAFWAFSDSTLGISGIFAKAIGIEQTGFSSKHFTMDLSGWIRTFDAWTYSSVDDPIGVITVPSGAASRYIPGDRLMFTNNGNVIKGIMVAVTDTSIKFLHEIDPTDGLALTPIVSGAITNCYYSHCKSPVGFPLDPNKWTVYLRYTTTTTISTPVNGTWYNPASQYLDVPIGCWRVKLSMCADAVRTGNEVTVYASLSTSSNSESDADFTTFGVFGATGATAIRTSLNAAAEKNLTVASKTRYYPIVKVGRDSVSNIYIQNSITPLSIRATCAYL